jgi:hypothetical protein
VELAEDRKAVVRRLIDEVYNAGKLDVVDELVAPEWVRHGLGGTARDPQVIKDRVRELREAFPDFHISIDDMLVDGDKVVVRQKHTGTHRGASLAPSPVVRR